MFVDRCRVWESHADPEIRRVSKPGPEPVYSSYVVGERDDGVDDGDGTGGDGRPAKVFSGSG